MRFTAETFDACRERERTTRVLPGGWLSDGTFAVLVEAIPSRVDETIEPNTTPAHRFQTLLKARQLAAVERRAWRIEGRPKTMRNVCEKCDGDGDLECDLGETHECKACRGKGGFGVVPAVAGQVVIDVVADGRTVILGGRFFPLFDAGLEICVLDDKTGAVPSPGGVESQPIVALRDGGVVVAFVLPIVGLVLQPGATP